MLTIAWIPSWTMGSERVENIEVLMFNQDRDTDITLNMADPEITMADMWPDRPDGIYYGPSSPGNIYDLDDWIMAENDYCTVGWFFEVSPDVVMSGAGEMWMKAPIVTNPTEIKTSELSIYKVTTYNFTISSLTNPIYQESIASNETNPISVGNGYISQLDNWGTLTQLENGPGPTLANRYYTFYDIYAPIYPNTKYFITQNVTYDAPATPFHPEISLSNEDISYDDVTFTYVNVGGIMANTNTGLPLDPDYAVVFVIGQVQGRAMIPIIMYPGDSIRWWELLPDMGEPIRWYFNIPLYPNTGPTNFSIKRTLVGVPLAYFNVTDGGIFFSDPLAYNGSYYIDYVITYNGPLNGTDWPVTVFIPCVDNVTNDAMTWVDMRLYNGTKVRRYNWRPGFTRFGIVGASLGINTGTFLSEQIDPVQYAKFYTKQVYSFASGEGKSEAGKLWDGAVKTVKYTGGLIWESTGIPAGVDALQSFWNAGKEGGLTPENIGKIMKEFASDVFDNVGGLFQSGMENITDFVNEFIIGEFVDKVQSAWGTFTDWIGNKLEDYLSPVIEIFHEIKAIITDVINALLDGLEYALSLGMKLSSSIALALSIPFFGLVGGAILYVPKYTRKNNPGSDSYGPKLQDWDRARGDE